MLENFIDYFRQIDMPEAIQRRAEDLCKEFSILIPSPIRRVFVTDTYDGEGVRRFHSLILVSEQTIMECKNFAVSDNIDFLNMECGIKLMEVHKSEIKEIHGDANPKSTVRVQLGFDGGGGPSGLLLHAAYNNCGYLTEFIREEFLTRLDCGVSRRVTAAQGSG